MDLVQTIAGRVPRAPHPVVLLCPPALAQELAKAIPDGARLLLVSDAARPGKLVRCLDDLPVVRAHPLQLPLPPRSAACLVAVDTLGRLGDPAKTLASLCGHLRPGGRLVTAERTLRSPTVRVLRRITSPSSRRLAPEDVCGLMLNAELAQIGQAWPEGYPGRFVTYGSLREA